MNEHENNAHARKPDFVAYQVQDTEDGKGIWNRIGAAWRHRDGHGIELNLNSLPVNGRVTLRELKEERMQNYKEQKSTQKATQEMNSRQDYSRSR
jgi:hypothetical protein